MDTLVTSLTDQSNIPLSGPPEKHSFDLFGNRFEETPLGFNNRRIPQTRNSPFDNPDKFLVGKCDVDRWQLQYLYDYERSQGFDVGVSFSIYKSGEFSAACTALGTKTSGKREKRGKIFSTSLSPTATKAMRRAIQNHWRPFTRMFTFTFDPSKALLNEDGTVDHEYAHSEISRTLATVSKRYQRLQVKTDNKNFSLSYIRVSEIQPQTGNIHFHVLVDRHVDIGYLVKIWGQSANSVDAQKISGMRGLKYLLSYVKKDTHGIYGKRYALSEDLYGEFKPARVSIVGRHARSIFLQYMSAHASSLLTGKGYLGDWGFVIPPPDRAGITKHNQRSFLIGLAESLDSGGYPELLASLLQDKSERG